MLSRAEEDLCAGRAANDEERARSEAQVARLASATKRAEELDARLLVELEVQRKLKQALHQAEMLLERESQRLVLVETELITKQVCAARILNLKHLCTHCPGSAGTACSGEGQWHAVEGSSGFNY